MIQPKISVVTVCYNAVNDIEEANLSVINLLEVKHGIDACNFLRSSSIVF